MQEFGPITRRHSLPWRTRSPLATIRDYIRRWANSARCSSNIAGWRRSATLPLDHRAMQFGFQGPLQHRFCHRAEPSRQRPARVGSTRARSPLSAAGRGVLRPDAIVNLASCGGSVLDLAALDITNVVPSDGGDPSIRPCTAPPAATMGCRRRASRRCRNLPELGVGSSRPISGEPFEQ